MYCLDATLQQFCLVPATYVTRMPTLWTQAKRAQHLQVSKAATTSGGQTIASQFRNPWPLEMGRVDSDAEGGNAVPPLDADVETIRVGYARIISSSSVCSMPTLLCTHCYRITGVNPKQAHMSPACGCSA